MDEAFLASNCALAYYVAWHITKAHTRYFHLFFFFNVFVALMGFGIVNLGLKQENVLFFPPLFY